MTMSTPDKDVSLHISMVSFVDDSTCVTGGNFSHTAVKDMIGRMQSDAQLSHDLLWTLGCKLELPKCSYHF